jgi:hypothetical protein
MTAQRREAPGNAFPEPAGRACHAHDLAIETHVSSL